MPKISVTVPVYKVESYLDRCVESVLGQTFTDFELILVDDGSPDTCPARCDAWAERDSRIRVIHKENGGLSDARNAGIDIAQGQWLTFIDSDDYVHPQMLEALYGAVTELGVQVSVCGYAETGGEPMTQPVTAEGRVWQPEEFYLQHNINAVVAWGKLYHRDCFREIRYPVGKLHEDEFVTYRLLLEQKQIAVVSQPLYAYFQNPKSIVHAAWSPRRLDALEGLRQQVEYMTANGYPRLAKAQLEGLVAHSLRQMRLIRQEAPEMSVHLQTCRQMLRLALTRWRKLGQFTLCSHCRVYEEAWPRWKYLFRGVRFFRQLPGRVVNKLRRMISKEK